MRKIIFAALLLGSFTFGTLANAQCFPQTNGTCPTETLGGNLTTGSAITFADLPTANELLYTTSARAVGQLISCANGIYITNGSSIPSCSSVLPSFSVGIGSAVTSTGPGGALTAPAFAAFGTTSSNVVQGGVITAGGPVGSGTSVPTITYNAAGQLTTVTSTAISATTINGKAVSPGGSYAPAHVQQLASNPTGTSSTTFVQLGLAGSITPVTSGMLSFQFTGTVGQTGTPGDCIAEITYGTGTAPTNGAAQTGSVAGRYNVVTPPATYTTSIMLQGFVTGLTLSTAYWFDVALAANTGATTCTVSLPSFMVLEQ